MDKPFDK